MKNRFKEFAKFTTSSLASTVVDLALFALVVFFLRERLPGSYILIATVLARTVSILVNYNLNAKLVFTENEAERKLPFSKYIALAIADMLASALFVIIIVDYLPVYETFAKMFVDSTLFFVGYWIQHKFIF